MTNNNDNTPNWKSVPFSWYATCLPLNWQKCYFYEMLKKEEINTNHKSVNLFFCAATTKNQKSQPLATTTVMHVFRDSRKINGGIYYTLWRLFCVCTKIGLLAYEKGPRLFIFIHFSHTSYRIALRLESILKSVHLLAAAAMFRVYERAIIVLFLRNTKFLCRAQHSTRKHQYNLWHSNECHAWPLSHC